MRERTKPRTSATATAMPTAADTKFCTASPAVWVTWLIAASPEYDCQLVFDTNETAVLNAWSEEIGLKPSDSGSQSCTRCSRYRNSTLTAEKTSTLRR